MKILWRKSEKRTAFRNGRQMYPVGIPLLLVTFLCVCLIVLGAGTYVMSREDYKEAGNDVERQSAYRNALNQAEERCQEIDQGTASVDADTFTIPIRTGGTLEVGIGKEDGSCRILWTRVIPRSSSATREQTLEGM